MDRGNPTEATKKVLTELQKGFNEDEYEIAASGTTGSARKLVGTMIGAQVVKNEITAHAVGTTTIHPDVRTILEIGGQDSKIICVENGVAVDYAMNTLCAAGDRSLSFQPGPQTGRGSGRLWEDSSFSEKSGACSRQMYGFCRVGSGP